MQELFDRQPEYRIWLLAGSLALLALSAGLTIATGNSTFLALALCPAVFAMLWISAKASINLAFLSLPVILVAGLQTRGSEQAAVWFLIPMLGLAVVLAFMLKNRQAKDQLSWQEESATLDEHLALMREQYKLDLILNISNRKKIEKYTLLSRISHTLGSQLQLEKLAETIILEAEGLIGAERGSYQLAISNAPAGSNALPFDSLLKPGTVPAGGDGEILIRSLPEGKETRSMLTDIYSAWVVQHRTSLLITDTQDDFRFQHPGTEAASRSLMVAPMLAEGRVTGLLRAESPWMGMFTEDDLRLFTVIADLAAAVAENAKLYQRAQELAITDGLTGLYLRRFFNQRFDEELSRFQEHGTPFTLLILDLDHFKRINDKLGHLAGDQILEQVAGILKNEARIADVPCRFGGEEFALILPNTAAEGGQVMAERIRTKIAGRDFLAGDEARKLTVSIGIGECPRHGRSQVELVKRTDQALYTAKHRGRNHSVMAEGGSAP